LAGGSSNSLSARADGTVWGWGNNQYRQLGDGGSDNRTSPVQTSFLASVVAVAAGEVHGLALRADGSVFSWGYNGYGELGDGTTDGRGWARPVPNFTTADQSWLDGDPDSDGLSTRRELALGTDPLIADTNGDGILDGAEVAAGRSATNMDMDGDGVLNTVEVQRGTDPFAVDSDGDSVPDGVDAFPLDPTRSQAPSPTPGDTSPPTITLIDPTSAVLISSLPPQ